MNFSIKGNRNLICVFRMGIKNSNGRTTAKFYLEIAGGILLLVFGVLFFLFLQLNFSEVTTIVIFIGAGILIIRRAALNRKQLQIEDRSGEKNQKTTGTKSDTKKIR